MATIRNDRDKALQAASVRVDYDTSIELSKYNAILAASTAGVVADNTVANVTVTIKVNFVVDATWTLSVAGTGCTAHVSGSTIVFDGFDVGNLTDSCSYVVTATKVGFTDLHATLEIIRVRAGATPSELSLTPSQISLIANYKGDVTSYVDAKSIAKVTTGSTDVTVDWTLSKEDSPGIATTLTGTEIQVVASVSTQDADCLYALDFEAPIGTLTSANILDSSARRRKSHIGVDNVPTGAAFLPVTISSAGPLAGIKAATFTSTALGASIVRSGNNTSTYIETDDLVNYMQKSFAISMYVSFDNASSALEQTIYCTSTYQPAAVAAMGPLRLIKTASTNRIDLVAINYSGYTSGQVLISTPATLNNNQFYHIAISYNSTGRILTMYLDGVLCGSITAAALSATVTSGCINLGSMPFNSANTGLNGKITLFRFWASNKFSSNFDKLQYSYKLPNTDLYTDKVVLGLDFTKGKLEELKGTQFTASGAISYHTDADGTGAILHGTIESGLLSSLKLTGPYCIELKYKCLSGFDFATAINSPIAFIEFFDKDNNSRFEHNIVNPGVLGGSAYTGFSMRSGPSSSSTITVDSTVLVTGTVYHFAASLEGAGYSARPFKLKKNGDSSTSNGASAWYHHAGIDEYRIKIGNNQPNKNDKWVLYWVRITSGTRRYDYDCVPPSQLETYSSSGYTDVTATKLTDTLTKRLSINKQVAAEVPSVFTYDPSDATIATDAYGWAPSLPSTNMSILVGNSNDTGNWAKTISANSGINGTITTNSLVVNSFVATNNVHVMLRGENFNDVSEYRKTFVAAASGSASVPTISADWSAFGGPGNHYKFVNSAGDQQYLQSSIAATVMHISTSDFTYECMFSTDSDPTVSTFQVPFWHRGTGTELFGSDLSILYTQTNGWRVSCSPNYSNPFDAGGSSTIFTFTTAPAIVRYKTYHVAVVRSGTNIYLYINGTRYTAGATVLTGGFSFYNTNQVLYVGYRPSTSYTSTMRFSNIRFTLDLARYTASTITPPIEPLASETSDTGYIDVTATKTGYNSLVKRFTVTKSKPTAPTKASAVASGSTSLITLAGDIYGAVSSFSGASATLSITIGGVNDTANWTITHTKSSVDIGTSLSGDTVSITSITNALDSGWVEFSATRNYGSWPVLTYRVSINKTKLLAPIYPTGDTYSRDDMRYNKIANVSIKYATDGRIFTKTSATSYVHVGNWFNPTTTGVGTGKYFRYNITGDTVTGETVNTWVELSTDRILTLSVAAGAGFKSTSITIEASTDSGGSTIVSTNYVLFDVDSYV